MLELSTSRPSLSVINENKSVDETDGKGRYEVILQSYSKIWKDSQNHLEQLENKKAGVLHSSTKGAFTDYSL